MPDDSKQPTPVSQLPPYDVESDDLNVVIETPKGSHIKFKYDERTGMFKAHTFMPEGMSFPYDFGFVPGTRADDGDPLDVLVIMDAPAFAGCLVVARVVGVIQADQTEVDGRTLHNDRLLAVAADSRLHRDVKSLDGLSSALLDEIEHFFDSYTEVEGKKFMPRGRAGPERARQIVEDSMPSKRRPAAPRQGSP